MIAVLQGARARARYFELNTNSPLGRKHLTGNDCVIDMLADVSEYNRSLKWVVIWKSFSLNSRGLTKREGVNFKLGKLSMFLISRKHVQSYVETLVAARAVFSLLA